jgi:heme A synthase
MRRCLQILTATALIHLFSWACLAQVEVGDEIPVASQATPLSIPTTPSQVPPPLSQPAPSPTVYTHAYEVRADIHKYASWATIPVFAAEWALGQSLYDNPSSSGARRGAHAAVGTAIVGLFGVQAVTGVWNLWASRHDPLGRKIRVAHSALMLASNVGLLVASANGPSSRKPDFNSAKVTHRNVAIASIGVGTAGYLLVLFRRSH